jgi:hypothetical protein
LNFSIRQIKSKNNLSIDSTKLKKLFLGLFLEGNLEILLLVKRYLCGLIKILIQVVISQPFMRKIIVKRLS